MHNISIYTHCIYMNCLQYKVVVTNPLYVSQADLLSNLAQIGLYFVLFLFFFQNKKIFPNDNQLHFTQNHILILALQPGIKQKKSKTTIYQVYFKYIQYIKFLVKEKSKGKK